jgi:hypothetical protein
VSTTSCPNGMYAPVNGRCVDAEPGSISIGNGDIVQVVDSVPPGFENACEGAACSRWTPERGGYLKSGVKTSTLRTVRSFVQAGKVEFEWQISGDDGKLRFFIDTNLVLEKRFNLDNFGDVLSSFDVSSGQHTFEWQFIGGSHTTSASKGWFCCVFFRFWFFFLSLFTHKGSYALVSEIRFYGSQYAPTSPILCPGGTYQPLASQSKCLQCPANTWSAPNASHCTACAAERYSLPGSRTCLARSPCSSTTDYEPFFTPCTGVNSSRVQYWTMLDPVHCYQTDVEKVSFCAEIM